ncbi:MAG: nucleotide exchange factor GrpE [Clostridia bacterium]
MSKKKEQTEAVATGSIVEPEFEPEGDMQHTADNAHNGEEQSSYTLTAEEFETAKKHIESLQKDKDETIALLQRNQADFDNFRRRNANIRTDSYDEGKRDSIKALLPVLDNFDRAMANDDAADDNWREGIKLVYRQLYELLEKQGLNEIDTDGTFDPNLHEAVMQEKVDGKENGEILAVLQKGYRVDDRIIRHSMVKVAE